MTCEPGPSSGTGSDDTPRAIARELYEEDQDDLETDDPTTAAVQQMRRLGLTPFGFR